MLLDSNPQEMMIKLAKILDELITKLEKAGMMPKNYDPAAKQDLIKSVVKTLMDDPQILLTMDKLTQPETLKCLGAACIAKADPKNTFDISKLFTDKLELSPQHNLLLKELYKLQIEKASEKDPIKRKELEHTMDKLTDVLLKVLKPEQNKELAKDLAIEEMLSKQRIADYGIDTQKPGMLLAVVQAVVTGNETGRMELSKPGEDFNFMAKKNEANLGVADPLGTKLDNAVNLLKDGAIPSETSIAKILSETLKVTLHESPRLEK